MMIPAPDEFRCAATLGELRCFKVGHLGIGPHQHEEARESPTYHAVDVVTWVDPEHPWPESEFPLGAYVQSA